MNYQANGITIFNNDEFLLLLAAAGMDRWYGLDLSEQKQGIEDERAFNTSLASLYQKGVVDWADGRAQIAEAYKPVFRTLRDAGVCILIKSGDEMPRIRACYCADSRVVTIERRTASESELELMIQTDAGWIEDIKTSGCLPVTAGEPEDGHVPAPDPQPYVTFELRSSPEGKLMQTMNIYEQGLYASMETSDGKNAARDLYSMEKAVRILKEWSGGIA